MNYRFESGSVRVIAEADSEMAAAETALLYLAAACRENPDRNYGKLGEILVVNESGRMAGGLYFATVPILRRLGLWGEFDFSPSANSVTRRRNE